jgi:LmbE family N-acetylglucosaminyl deacetylase
MSREAFRLGDELTARIPSFSRPIYVVAHHDDEIPTAGLLQRLGPRTRVVFVTNSDGLYFESQLKPPEYGELRKAEGFRSLATIGLPPENVVNCDFSEVEIYRRMAWLYSGAKTVADVKPFFQEMRDSVRKAVFEARPDVVFTQAWQGGQPEHDLAHFFAVLAVRDYCREAGVKVEVFHLPAYEYTILVAMRFHPLYKGVRVRLRLTPEEYANKLKMLEAYPSQVRLFGDFRKVFRWVSPFWRPFGGPATMEDMLRTEELGPVPDGIDYTRSTHWFDFCDYMFDDFEGTKVTFKRSVRPIVQAFLEG